MPACQACSLKLRRSSGLTMPGAARYSRNHRICARNRLVGRLEMIAEAESLAQPRVQASDPVLLCLSFAGVSSNGRTLVFGASYLGSNPGTPAIFLSPPHALRLCSPSASSSRNSVRSGALSYRSGMPGKECLLYICVKIRTVGSIEGVSSCESLRPCPSRPKGHTLREGHAQHFH